MGFGSRALARFSDPDTSKEAARRMKTAALEVLVVACLVYHGPQTIREVAGKLGKEQIVISPRFAPLARKGYIEDTGIRKVSRVTNRRVIIWRVTPMGKWALKRVPYV